MIPENLISCEDYDIAEEDFNARLNKLNTPVQVGEHKFNYSYAYRELIPSKYFKEFEDFIKTGIVVGDYE